MGQPLHCVRPSAALNAQNATFSHSYEQLKAAIYRFERDHVNDVPIEAYSDDAQDRDLEAAHLLTENRTAADKLYLRLLNKELDNVTSFYADKERELLSDLQLTLQDADRIQNEGVFVDESDYEDGDEGSDDESDDDAGRQRRPSKSTPKKRRKRAMSSTSQASQQSKDADLIALHDGAEEAIPEDEETTPLKRKDNSTGGGRRKSVVAGGDATRASIWSSSSGYARDTRITFKMRLQAHYRELAQLKSFVALNYTGFRKALKKCIARALLYPSSADRRRTGSTRS